jgi:hypothetical protein
MPFAEDLAPFLSANEFASDGLLNGAPVQGVFDNGYETFDVLSGASASGPVYLLPSASVPAQPIGLPLVIGADTWKVVEAQPDGTGMTTLRLRKP